MLRRQPWLEGHGATQEPPQSLLLHLLATATQLGYRILVSADVSGLYIRDHSNMQCYPMDVNTIYMVKLAGSGEEKRSQQPPSYMAATMFG